MSIRSMSLGMYFPVTNEPRRKNQQGRRQCLAGLPPPPTFRQQTFIKLPLLFNPPTGPRRAFGRGYFRFRNGTHAAVSTLGYQARLATPGRAMENKTQAGIATDGNGLEATSSASRFTPA